ncbi:uncharacterized protein LOC133911236 [Phragmites australis]|uniref:uncharacterized protein LOC133911236 n=1 Tax=Phragmites australis TaxID=29695 RepID=UPI002D78E336|nr:uncharacterized protein LOC133911236 [Phragmites australis]
MASAASFPACMKGERVRVFRPYYESVVLYSERQEEESLTLVELQSGKLMPPLSVGEALLMEGHGLRCDCSVDAILDLPQERVLINVRALDCQVRPCNACGSLGLQIPIFSEGLVGKTMRFSRLGPQNVTEAVIKEVERRNSSLSIVHLEALATPIPFCLGDLLVLESLDGQHQREADVGFCGDSIFFENYNEQRSLESSVSVYVRDEQANRGPKLLPQTCMGIFVDPVRISPSTDNGRGTASQRRATVDEAKRKIKIGINGYGSIGRAMARVALESQDVELVAINEPSITMDQMTCMFRDMDGHDGQWFRSDFKMKNSNTLMFGEKEVTIFTIEDINTIPWNEVGAEYIVAARVDMSDADYYKARTSKYNHCIDVSSNFNTFRNCLCPLAEILRGRFGTVEDVRTTWRAPVLHIIPRNNNAAKAIGEVLPYWKGMPSGLIFQVPTVDASPVDITIEVDAFKEYGLMLINTKPSYGFSMLLAWCVEMIRQIPQVTYCKMNYK